MHISSKCSIALHCLVFICDYGNTTRVTSGLLALSTGSNSVVIRNIVSALKKDGILHIKPGTGGTTICCPLQEITLYRVYRAVEPDFLDKLFGIHTAPSSFCLVGQNINRILEAPYAKVRQDLQKCLQGITLEDIVEEFHRQQESHF